MKIKNKKISITSEALCRGFPEEFVKYFEHCRNLGFEDKPDYTGNRRMFSELMNSENYSYDFQYDWLLKKSERLALLKDYKVEIEDEKEEAKIMTKAEKFRMTNQNNFKDGVDVVDMKNEEKKNSSKDDSNEPVVGKPKPKTKQSSNKRMSYNTKDKNEKEEKKKPDIYEAMKGAGFEVAKPKIVTNNVRSYRF